jgi:hypothetical protein
MKLGYMLLTNSARYGSWNSTCKQFINGNRNLIKNLKGIRINVLE